MVVALATPATPLAAPRCRVVISHFQGNIAHHSCPFFSGSHCRRLFVAQSLKLQATEHFGEPNMVLDSLAVSLLDISPNRLKEFPWRKAKNMVLERLFSLGKNALKWSFIAWFVVSFVSDVFLAISRNREVMIPLGLFIGIALADFLKESAQEFFQSSTKDAGFIKNLLGIGSFFVLIKFLSSCIKMGGQTFISHIGNGGLMQVLFLAKELQQTGSTEHQEEQTLDAPTSSSED